MFSSSAIPIAQFPDYVKQMCRETEKRMEIGHMVRGIELSPSLLLALNHVITYRHWIGCLSHRALWPNSLTTYPITGSPTSFHVSTPILSVQAGIIESIHVHALDILSAQACMCIHRLAQIFASYIYSYMCPFGDELTHTWPSFFV